MKVSSVADAEKREGQPTLPTPMFSIRHDDEHRLLHVVRWGLWDEEQAASYRTGLAAAVSDAERRWGRFDILVDIGRAETMPQSATRIMAAVADDLEAGRARRVAFAGPGALKRLQVRRLVGESSRFGFFDTSAQALDWLGS